MWQPTFSVLMPHPPIVVPAVGGARHGQCQTTYDACREAARRLVATDPDRVVLVSPHAPRRRASFGLWAGERLRGDLARFGAPQARVDLVNEPDLSAYLTAALEGTGEGWWAIPGRGYGPGLDDASLDHGAFLDHGSVIPLWFLAEAGWSGPTAILSLPWHPEPERLQVFGRALARALGSLGETTALVASGDMSHRVLPGAPAGYQPRGIEFDRRMTELIEAGALDELAALDPELRELAAEDAADSSILVSAASDHRADGAEVLAYEHPFGVGYLVAVLFEPPGGAARLPS